MNTLTRLSLLFAFSTTLSAQTFDLRDAHTVVRDDKGTVWAIGRDHKAKITGNGMTFVPALGMRATGNPELTLRPARITRDESVWWHTEAASATEPRVLDDVVTIARGTCTETYDCRAEGIEQSFVFAERPDGTGDLVVHCDVTSSLRPTVRPDGSLFFHDGMVGGVTIGAVTGIDALGRTCRGSMHLRESTITYCLPESFVDAAAYPLTLDPLLATGFLIGDPTNDDDQVDAAYGAATDTTLVVWRRAYSQWNQDIYGQQIASNGSLSGPLLVITLAAHADRSPSVSYVHGRSRHVVCWLEASSMIGPWTVKARPVNGSTLGSTITVSGNTVPNGKWIATSGDRSTFGTDTLVVWATTFGSTVFGQDLTILRTSSLEVSLSGSLSASPPVDLTSTLLASTSDVFALPKSRAPAGITALAVHVPGQTSQHRVHALDYDGVYLGQSQIVAITDPGKEPVVAIDGYGTDFVVACRNFAGEMQTLAMTWTGSTFQSTGVPTVIGTPASRSCAVGYLGERFLVAWTEGTPNPFDHEIRTVAMKPDCALCSQTSTLATVARPNALDPAIASELAGAGTAQRALLAWDETNITSSFTGSVVGQRFAAMVGTPPVTLTPGCGNGGLASAIGAFSPGNENFKFKLTGGDPTAPFALISLSLGGPSVLCGCELTQWIVLEAVFAVNGGADFPFVPWCDPSYLGTTIEFQWLLLGAAASPCPFVPNLAASNRVRVTLNP